jgi:amino acid transporter
LIARSHVILNYCYGHDGELKRKWFKVCSPQTVISFVLIILQLIVVVIVLAAAPPNVLTTSELDVEYIECASHSRPEFLPLVFFILALIMAFNILHMSEECSPSNQNEVKFVSLGIYLMYALIFIYFVAVFGINGKKKIRVLCALSYLMGVNFLVSVFLPKIYVILFKPEENLPDVSCLLKDENGNQDVSRLSRRECVGSPLLGLEAGPYDRTEV